MLRALQFLSHECSEKVLRGATRPLWILGICSIISLLFDFKSFKCKFSGYAFSLENGLILDVYLGKPYFYEMFSKPRICVIKCFWEAMFIIKLLRKCKENKNYVQENVLALKRCQFGWTNWIVWTLNESFVHNVR